MITSTLQQTRINTQRLRYLNEPLMDKIDGEKIAVLHGDWDLRSCPVKKITADSLLSFMEPVPVLVGRDGDPIIAGMHANMQEWPNELPVTVVGRHWEWQAFIDEIRARLSYEEDQLAYAPLTHFDLSHIKSWNQSDRIELIIPEISPSSKTVLDIGAHWGYMCEQLEAHGLACTAVEAEPYDYYFMRKLKRAGAYNYTAVHSDIFDYVKPGQQFDVVLSLAIFHHFIKKKQTHDKLQQLLKDLDMNEMFFWVHNPEEPQMKNAYRNYQPEEFVEFILQNSCLNNVQVLGEIEYRTMFKLFK